VVEIDLVVRSGTTKRWREVVIVVIMMIILTIVVVMVDEL